MIGFGRIGAFLGVPAFGLFLAMASCGGGSSTPGGAGGTGGSGVGGTGGTSSPGEACKSLASVICTRDNTCNAGGHTPAEITMCTNENLVALGCDRATSAGFADCLKDAQTLTCASLFPAPDHLFLQPGSCDDPISSTPFSDVQNKCGELASAYCDRYFSCKNIAAPDATQSANCLQSAFGGFDCYHVTGIGPTATFDQCKMEIGNIPCTAPDGGVDGGATDGGSAAASACNAAVIYAP
jgi:hypothetical protein